MSDQQLVSDFLKSCSEKAFQKLYRDKTPHLYQMALRLTTYDENQAQELIQSMWVTAIRKLETFQWKSTLKTWLTGILINLNREEIHREQKKKETEILDEHSSVSSSTSHSGYDLENALSKLSIGYRRVIILHDIEGYQHKEIAAILNIEEGTSKSQLFQARKRLRTLLSEKSGHHGA